MADLVELKAENQKVRKALLVGVYFESEQESEAQGLLDELEELVESIGFVVAGRECVRLREVNPHYFVGSGKFEEIKKLAKKLKCDCIVFDDSITPAQQRNWEHDSHKCVIDRQEVILEIFAHRAATKEARLQVELARLKYSLPRLKRAWTHFGRQRGGGVTQRGSGESQLETDRRRVLERLSRLDKELEVVRKNREVGRKRRQKSDVPNVAIVGYTNAGKSSLLNKIANSDVLAEDKLFATLDPTTREIHLPNGAKILATDTVGFVRKLPHNFIEAFKSTLEEAVLADLLIHVVDASSPNALAHIKTTEKVLAELGASEKRSILILNKCDMVDFDNVDFRMLKFEYPDAIEASVLKGQGLDLLLSRLESFAFEGSQVMEFVLPHNAYSLVGTLENLGAVFKKVYCDGGILVSACVPQRYISQIEKVMRKPSQEERKMLLQNSTTVA